MSVSVSTSESVGSCSLCCVVHCRSKCREDCTHRGLRTSNASYMYNTPGLAAGFGCWFCPGAWTCTCRGVHRELLAVHAAPSICRPSQAITSYYTPMAVCLLCLMWQRLVSPSYLTVQVAPLYLQGLSCRPPTLCNMGCNWGAGLHPWLVRC